MNDFKRIYEALVSGIDVFHFVPVSDIMYMPTAKGLQVNELDIELKEGAKWRIGLAENDSLSYEEPSQETVHSQLFKKSLKGFLPGDDVDMATNFYQNRYTPLVVKYYDRGGTRRIIGSLEEPVFLSFDFKQSANPTGGKGYNFMFYGSHTTPSAYLKLPLLPQFYQENGFNIYRGDLEETITAPNGYLLVEGPQEGKYKNIRGFIHFDLDG